MIDVYLREQGSISLLSPMSEAGEEWIDSNLPEDHARLGRASVVEHRYLANILEGMLNDGIVVGSPRGTLQAINRR